MKKWMLAIMASIALTPTLVLGQNLDANGKLPRSTPEAVGASSETLAAALAKLDAETNRIDSIMILRRGKVIAEAWRAPHGPNV